MAIDSLSLVQSSRLRTISPMRTTREGVIALAAGDLKLSIRRP